MGWLRITTRTNSWNKTPEEGQYSFPDQNYLQVWYNRKWHKLREHTSAYDELKKYMLHDKDYNDDGEEILGKQMSWVEMETDSIDTGEIKLRWCSVVKTSKKDYEHVSSFGEF